MELSTLTEHIKEQAQEEQQHSKTVFPIEVFPLTARSIISELHSGLNYPIDYTAASMLCAISAAVGNTHAVKVINGWVSGCPIWVALVGRPGAIKSHPLNMAIKPTKERDAYYYRKYKEETKEYKAINDLTAQQRKDVGETLPPEPKRTQFIVSDTTPEALAGILETNPRGIMLHRDELAGWIKDFGRYSKGGEQENWLSIWSQSQITINRKNAGNCVIPLPFVTVCGTLQTNILEDLAAGGRSDNGFVDRLLFAMPETDTFSTLTDYQADESIFIAWQRIIERLLEIQQNFDDYDNVQPIVLSYAPEAKSMIMEWDQGLSQVMRGTTDNMLLGIYSKQKTYLHRFALILQMFYYSEGEEGKDFIGIRAAQGAMKISEYFRQTAIKAAQYIARSNPVELLPENKRMLYRLLPEEFTTKEAMSINEKLDEKLMLSKPGVKRFLSEKELFAKVRHGVYEKIAA